MPSLIAIEQLEAGMELATPIKNKFGQLLLPAGVLLEEKHKKLLKTWGITSIYVKDETTEPTESKYNEEDLERAKILLAERMTWSPRNAVENDLKEIALNKLLEKNF